MVYFLNSKVKTHTENALQYIFDENKQKNCKFRLQYSIEEISPAQYQGAVGGAGWGQLEGLQLQGELVGPH